MDEHNLYFKDMKEHTFKHHSGQSSSQIDYIISTHQNVIQRYQIGRRDGENSSSHVNVSCYLNIALSDSLDLAHKQTSHSVRKLQWDKINQTRYETTLETETNHQRTSDLSADTRLSQLTANLHKAAEAAVPSKITKLKGPTWKASPTVRVLLKDCEEKYKHWIENGGTHPSLRSENIQAKRNLRKQLRKETFNDRRTFYETLMSKPSTEMFYKLLRRNKGGSGPHTSTLVVNGKEISTPEQQRKVFANYYEDLSVPKDKQYDSAFLELCSVRHELITQICEESSLPFKPVTPAETKKAVSQLNNKKAPDEYGLSAEHLKYAGIAVIEDITDIFNQIIFEKQVPSFFKSGILIPVLKKSKDPTNMDNYRGITVTPVLGKLFENVLLPRLSETFEQLVVASIRVFERTITCDVSFDSIFLQPLSNAQIITHRHLFTNWPKHILFAAVAFIPLLIGKLDIKS